MIFFPCLFVFLLLTLGRAEPSPSQVLASGPADPQSSPDSRSSEPLSLEFTLSELIGPDSTISGIGDAVWLPTELRQLVGRWKSMTAQDLLSIVGRFPIFPQSMRYVLTPAALRLPKPAEEMTASELLSHLEESEILRILLTLEVGLARVDHEAGQAAIKLMELTSPSLPAASASPTTVVTPVPPGPKPLNVVVVSSGNSPSIAPSVSSPPSSRLASPAIETTEDGDWRQGRNRRRDRRRTRRGEDQKLRDGEEDDKRRFIADRMREWRERKREERMRRRDHNDGYF